MDFNPQRITIYSVGLLGGSLGLALKASGYKGKLTGLSSAESIHTAKSLGCIDEGYPYEKLAQVIQDTDVLFLCSPINAIIEIIERLGSLKLPDGLIITDVGSTKSLIMEKAKSSLPANVHFIGGHPMAGSERRGVSAADPYLFQNAIYILTPDDKTPKDLVSGLSHFLQHNLGCRQVILDAATHDTVVAAVSHLPHLLAVSLVNFASMIDKRKPGALGLAAGGFRDMTRIASAPYSVWHDILTTNKESIGLLLDEYIKQLSDVKQRLLQDNLAEAFTEAKDAREKMPLSSKGFNRALSDVLVHAKDQPGFIASLAATLAEQKINIKDIEVLKVREGEGGTIRLAFETAEVAKRAVDLLRERGFSARERN
jgi:prephenate dehydrogenase